MRLVITGHCYSLKNHRPIFKGKGGCSFLGKSKALREYEERALVELLAQWRPRPPLRGPVRVSLRYYYRGKKPDALGFAETVFDALQEAAVVDDDVQLVPWGVPAIARIHAASEEEERVEICVSST